MAKIHCRMARTGCALASLTLAVRMPVADRAPSAAAAGADMKIPAARHVATRHAAIRHAAAMRDRLRRSTG
ncbi:MAG: hypothetical protein KDJ76_05035 [Xanthobacteraceae bacterium]|nr:hypothetical protein [Xanthobacteraceae bacterium]